MYATVATELAEKIAEILARNLGIESTYFQENCTSKSCYLRMNRYPPCPFPAEVFGLVPHTDSDFLTIVCQDGAVGGLQLMKGDGSWVGVSPNPDALIVNVGDLFQVILSLIDCDVIDKRSCSISLHVRSHMIEDTVNPSKVSHFTRGS